VGGLIDLARRFTASVTSAMTAGDIERAIRLVIRSLPEDRPGRCRKVDTVSTVTMTSTARLNVSHVTKLFDATVALDDVSFEVGPGRIHALLGANGAGKSTLIKIMAGLYPPDGGTVLVDGVPARHAISFIHQDLGLVDTMTVDESVAVTRGFPRRAGLIQWSAVRRIAQRALAVLGAAIPGDTLISDLSRADRSIVAIARAITDDCKVLVLDEPTASLPDVDVQRLFAVVKALSARGVSVLYVTHRLDEVFEIADEITVLRDGRAVVNVAVADVSREQLVRYIVGGELPTRVKSAAGADPAVVLRLNGIQLSDDRPPVEELHLVAGEILGLAGLRGGGQELLGRGLAGVEPLDCRNVLVDELPRAAGHVQSRLKTLVGFASSRREQEGLAMTLSIRENLFMNPAAGGYHPVDWMPPGAERKAATAVGGSVRLRPNASENVVATLSGGNQQKVVLGRWLATSVRVLVLEEPTMGIDVGARAEIYELIGQAVARGLSVVVVSSDFDELALLCHRVVVLDRGAVSKELLGAEVSLDNITHYSSTGVPTNGKRHG